MKLETIVGLHIFLGYRLGKYDNPPLEKSYAFMGELRDN